MTSLTTMLTGRLAVFMTLGAVLVCILIDTLVRRQLEEQLVTQIRAQCTMVDLVLPARADSMQHAVEQTSRAAMTRIMVVDESGTVVANSDPRIAETDPANYLSRSEIRMAGRSPSGYGYRFQPDAPFGEDLLHVAYKSTRGRYIVITHDTSHLSGLMFRLRLVYVFCGVMLLSVTVIMHRHFARRVTAPLRALLKASSDIRNGKYDSLVDSSDTSEIGQLAHALNDMASRVRKDIERLSTVQEIRRDFVANASHELRTPISSIRGYIETLLDGATQDEAVHRRFLERALSNVIRLENIVNDMLDLSQLESRDRGLSLRYFQAGGIIRGVLADFEDAAQRKSLKLLYESSLPTDMEILADPYQFEKALINLVENGVKYTETGYVKVTTSREPEQFVLTIEDTGPGIRTEDIPRIFERFYRVDKARSRQMGGSGLGLSIVRHIMEIHGGSVSVESELGKGSKFILRFPLNGELSIGK